MQLNNFKKLNPSALLFLLGFIGVLTMPPLIPQLLAIIEEKPPLPLVVIQVIATIQSSVLLFLMVWLGTVYAKRVGLTAPVIVAIARSEDFIRFLKPQILPALLGGVAAGIFLVAFYAMVSPFLPAEFITAAEKLTPPWYTKLLYGGITEEILIRWGLMSFFVWAFYRLTQQKNTDIKTHNYMLAIVVSSLIFGLGHLPIALSLSPTVTVTLVSYIIIGNAVFGFVAGYLYWKRGLECAILAHMVAHVTMIFAIKFV